MNIPMMNGPGGEVNNNLHSPYHFRLTWKLFGTGDSNQLPDNFFHNPTDIYGAHDRSRSDSNTFEFVQRPEHPPHNHLVDFDPLAYTWSRSSNSPYVPGRPNLNQYPAIYNTQSVYGPGPASDHGSVSVYSNNHPQDYQTISTSSLGSISHLGAQYALDVDITESNVAVVGEEVVHVVAEEVQPGTKQKPKRSRPKAEKPIFPCDYEGCDKTFGCRSAFAYVSL